jgi:hypothetical protein
MPNLTNRLFGALWAKAQVSAKSKERLTSPEAYFALKGALENKTIFGGDLFELFERASIDEVKEMSLNCDSAPHFLNSYTLYFLLNDALRKLIDAGKEKDEKTVILRQKYLEIQRLYPELSDKTDLFKLYLAEREKRQLAEHYRLTGEGCPYCLSTTIQSYGDKWHCTTCKHYWRKH